MIYRFGTVDSTNNQLKKMLRNKQAQDGDVVIAKTQISGRGRSGRAWLDTAGKSLLFSVLFDAEQRCITVENILLFPLAIGIATVKAIQNQTMIDLQTKWPNDLLVDGKKVCGILCESIFEGETPKFVIAGIGLNVNQKISDFPTDLSENATSLYMVDGQIHHLEKLLKNIIEAIELWTNPVVPKKNIQVWCEICAHMNSDIQFHDGKQVISGLFRGLNVRGAAILETEAGELAFYSGDILKYKQKRKR